MKTTPVSLGFSPCPNDTFIFHALTHGIVPLAGVRIHERVEDVETLNSLALKGALDVSKVSYHAFGHVREEYGLLRSGSALGRGCGPLLVAREECNPACLSEKRVAIPGELTTAKLLLQLYNAQFTNLVVLPFDEIMSTVQEGSVDAGVIIHESRFTYREHGLVELIDLGAWWEEETGLPIPLGGIIARRNLDQKILNHLDAAIRESLLYANRHAEASHDYIRQHAQELDDEVIENHIGLYVNDFSLELGKEGVAAIEELFSRAEAAGVLPKSSAPIFIDDAG